MWISGKNNKYIPIRAGYEPEALAMLQSHRELSTIGRTPIKIARHDEEAILGGLLYALQNIHIRGLGNASVTKKSVVAPVSVKL